jgi:CheY-like chemotaxis protein
MMAADKIWLEAPPWRSAADKLALVQDLLGVGIFERDLRTLEARWDASMFKLFGLDETLGAPHFDAFTARVHPDDRERFLAELAHSVRIGGRHRMRFRTLLSDGSACDVLSLIEVRHDDEGHPLGLIGVSSDDSEGAERFRAQRAASDLAMHASQARSEFLARASHELRTPLNAVIGFAQLIKHDGVQASAVLQLERVAHILSAGERLLSLVNDVLDLAVVDKAETDASLQTAAPARATGPTFAAPALTVLYIEDNAVNVILVEGLIALRPGVELRCAVDGLSGVAMAIEQRPQVVLIDMQLPDIDGLEVLRRLRAEPGLRESRMVALSANSVSEDISRALAEGFDDYWTKPIDFKLFLERLDALTDEARTRVR